MVGKLSVVFMILCLAGSGLSITCWQTSDNNATDNMKIYNRDMPGVIMERTCTAPRCLGILYQVVDQWFYQAGCTEEAVMNIETKRGKGKYYKMVCDKDWCNSAHGLIPSMFIFMMAAVVKQIIN